MTKAPTAAAVTEYLTGYYEQNEECVSFKIKGITRSVEGPHCLEAETTATWKEEGSVFYHEKAIWTLWIEDGQVTGDC